MNRENRGGLNTRSDYKYFLNGRLRGLDIASTISLLHRPELHKMSRLRPQPELVLVRATGPFKVRNQSARVNERARHDAPILRMN